MENSYPKNFNDSIYLNERRYETPKESFKQIADILNLKNVDASKSLVDIGCATGEFLYYLRTINANMHLSGIEYSENLINDSRVFLAKHNIEVTQGDAHNLSAVKDSQYDYVTTIGVTHAYDDYKPWFNEMIRIANDGALCINHMLVNEMDVDVIVRYINPENQALESGFNKFSIKSIRTFLEQHKDVKSVEFIKHEMPFDIPKKDDPIRSWTINRDGKRLLWNGLNMEISLYHVVIRVEKK